MLCTLALLILVVVALVGVTRFARGFLHGEILSSTDRENADPSNNSTVY